MGGGAVVEIPVVVIVNVEIALKGSCAGWAYAQEKEENPALPLARTMRCSLAMSPMCKLASSLENYLASELAVSRKR